jgi:RecA-family ATPase
VVSLAANLPVFGNWTPTKCNKVVLISGEDTSQILHHRFYDVIKGYPQDKIKQLDFKLFTCSGDVAIIKQSGNEMVADDGRIEVIQNILTEYEPDLLILDTFSRFVVGDENNNSIITGACAKIEEILGQHNCSGILIHHTNKQSGDLTKDAKSLDTALSQVSMRGASSLVGAIRWALIMAPISTTLARRLLNNKDLDEPDGTYVTAKVCKKNVGQLESYIVLSKANGTMARMYPQSENQDALDAMGLIGELENHQSADKFYLGNVKAIMNWGEKRANSAIEYASNLGFIRIISDGRRKYLELNETEKNNERK